jgi:transcriptional regulator with XRE-family HTH domain
MSLGNALRQLRKSKSITLADLAARAGSHVGNLSRIERGTAKPSLDLLYRLSEALDFTLAEIFAAADHRTHDERQIALNSIFISLLDEDRELLVEFARLLQRRASRPDSDIFVDAGNMPSERNEEEDQKGEAEQPVAEK